MAGTLEALDHPARRFEALAVLEHAELVHLAETILDGSLGEVQVVIPPTVGMLMARAVDGARGEVFNVGEALVTEARVALGRHEGWGMVMGAQPEHALAFAIVDAGLAAGHPRAATVEREVLRLAEAARERDLAEARRVAPTRVQFETF